MKKLTRTLGWLVLLALPLTALAADTYRVQLKHDDQTTFKVKAHDLGDNTFAEAVSLRDISGAVETAGANRQEVGARQIVDNPIDAAGTALAVKFARINATADGDNTVVAAVASKKIRVCGYALSVTAAGTISLQDTATTPAVHAQFSLAANGVVSYAGDCNAPAIETAAGEGVEVNNPTGVDTLGHLTYVER